MAPEELGVRKLPDLLHLWLVVGLWAARRVVDLVEPVPEPRAHIARTKNVRIETSTLAGRGRRRAVDPSQALFGAVDTYMFSCRM